MDNFYYIREKYKPMATQILSQKLIEAHEKTLKELEKKASDREIFQYKRSVYTNNLFLLSYYLLETDSNRRVNLLDDYIVEYCTYLQEDISNRLYLISRGHFKSTIGTENNNIRRYLKKPSTTIGIFSDTEGRATDWLSSIKNKLRNPELIKLFPEILKENIRDYEKWGATELVLTGHIPQATPTMGAYGLLGNMPTGLHFEFQTVDDIVNPRNCDSPTQIMKVRNALGFLKPLGLTGGREVREFIGTTYDPDDAYAIMKKSPKYEKIIMPYFKVDDKGNLTKEPISSLGSYQEIEDMINDPMQGIRLVMSQYLLTPMSNDSIKLNAEQVQYFSEFPENRNFKVYITLDPAISESKDSCENAISVVCISELSEWYIPEYHATRTSAAYRPSVMIKQMFHYHKKYSEIFGKENVYFVIETAAYQKSLKYFIEDESIRQKYPVIIKEYSPRGDKIKRIFDNLEPPIAAGAFYVKPEMTEIVHEFIKPFPFIHKLDILDSISQVNMVRERTHSYKYNKPFEPPPEHTEEWGRWIEQFYNRPEIMSEDKLENYK